MWEAFMPQLAWEKPSTSDSNPEPSGCEETIQPTQNIPKDFRYEVLRKYDGSKLLLVLVS